MRGKNFSDLIQDVYDKLDYNPELARYRNEVARRINDCYMELVSRHPWRFLQKTTTLQLRKEVKPASDSETISNNGSNRRQINVTGATPFKFDMAGQLLIINDVEFRIQRVITSTQLYLTSSPGSVSGVTSWSVKYDKYLLPYDCKEVKVLVPRNDARGRLLLVSREEEAALDLQGSMKGTGTSTIAYEQDWILDEAPPYAPALSTSAGGSLSANTTYEYAYSFVREGRESALSAFGEITTTASNMTVQVTPIQVKWEDATGGRVESGILRRIYRRDQTNQGHWMRVAQVDTTNIPWTDDGVIDVNDDGTVDPDVDYFNYAKPEWQGPRQYIKFWYDPGDDREVELLYQSLPAEMSADTDRPLLPFPYERILVDMVMFELAVKINDAQAREFYRGRVDTRIRELKKGYLMQDAVENYRKSWKGRARRWIDYGVPTRNA